MSQSASDDLLEHYRDTHKNRVYGTSSVKYLRFLRPWIKVSAPKSVLDYGCGQSILLDTLNLSADVALLRYDPAIEEYAALPATRADVLINIDVLEHIPERQTDTVLAEMRDHSKRALLVIDTKPSNHTLPDGSNAHVTLHDGAWWQERIARVFGCAEPIATTRRSRVGFKTWSSSPAELAKVRAMRMAEDAHHLWLRARGQHKAHWKISSTD